MECVFPMVVLSILPHAEFGPMTIRKTRPTLHVLGHFLKSSIWVQVYILVFQPYVFKCIFQSIFLTPQGMELSLFGTISCDWLTAIPWDTHHFLSYNKYPTVFILLQNIARSVWWIMSERNELDKWIRHHFIRVILLKMTHFLILETRET